MLRSKGPEAEYLAALRGIITGPWLVVPNQLSNGRSGLWLGRIPGRCRTRDLSGAAEGGIRREWSSVRHARTLAEVKAGRADLEEIGPARWGVLQDLAAIELSS
jgi:hypothetical protein